MAVDAWLAMRRRSRMGTRVPPAVMAHPLSGFRAGGALLPLLLLSSALLPLVVVQLGVASGWVAAAVWSSARVVVMTTVT
ncbi:hypothetical protein, partial [Mycolicibacterium fallax]